MVCLSRSPALTITRRSKTSATISMTGFIPSKTILQANKAEIIATAHLKLAYATKMSDMESMALKSDSATQDARAKLIEATRQGQRSSSGVPAIAFAMTRSTWWHGRNWKTPGVARVAAAGAARWGARSARSCVGLRLLSSPFRSVHLSLHRQQLLRISVR